MVFGGHCCLPSSPSLSSPIKYKWFLGDYEAIESYLFNIDWYVVLQLNPSAEAAWDTFMSILYYVIDRYVPHLNCIDSRPKRYWRSSRVISKCTAKKRRYGAILNATHMTVVPMLNIMTVCTSDAAWYKNAKPLLKRT